MSLQAVYSQVDGGLKVCTKQLRQKEGVTIQKESKTFASITYQNYFRMYDKLSGMTGTALTSQEEFFTVYNLEVIPVPTNREVKRIDRNDLIYQNESGKFKAIIEKVKEVHAKGQPILIGTASIDSNERLSKALTVAGIKHEMLNAKTTNMKERLSLLPVVPELLHWLPTWQVVELISSWEVLMLLKKRLRR